ncbi:MAG TPA: signal peptidase I [Longimicrobiales bacterium]
MKVPRSVRTPAREHRHHSMYRTLLEWARSMLSGLLLFLVIRTFVLQTFAVISGSMENTFLVGDFVVVNKVAWGASLPFTNAHVPGVTAPKRGDVVVFKSNHDDPPENIVKRIIATPGDTVAMRNGLVMVNGVALAEPYTQHVDPQYDDVVDAELLWQRGHLADSTPVNEYFPTRESWGPLLVPPDSYFVLGDNRDQSYDSRYWGFVKREEIIGRADVIYFSKAKGGPPRWNRIGDRIR